MWPAGGRALQAPSQKGGGSEGRQEGHWEGSSTWAASPRTKPRVASCSAEGASCLAHQMTLMGAPSPPCSTEEVVTGEVGFEESWQEYPILKIPPSCSHPKNTSATNFPQRVPCYPSHFSLGLFACREHPGEVLVQLCLLASASVH